MSGTVSGLEVIYHGGYWFLSARQVLIAKGMVAAFNPQDALFFFFPLFNPFTQ